MLLNSLELLIICLYEATYIFFAFQNVLNVLSIWNTIVTMLNIFMTACGLIGQFFRFLKSDLYKDSLLADMGGTPLPINGQDQTDPQLAVDLNVPLNVSTDGGGNGSNGKPGKGGKDEGSRRKSILPWGRNRSKSKDRAEQDRISLFKKVYFSLLEAQLLYN